MKNLFRFHNHILSQQTVKKYTARTNRSSNRTLYLKIKYTSHDADMQEALLDATTYGPF